MSLSPGPLLLHLIYLVRNGFGTRFAPPKTFIRGAKIAFQSRLHVGHVAGFQLGHKWGWVVPHLIIKSLQHSSCSPGLFFALRYILLFGILCLLEFSAFWCFLTCGIFGLVVFLPYVIFDFLKFRLLASALWFSAFRPQSFTDWDFKSHLLSPLPRLFHNAFVRVSRSILVNLL